MRHILSIIICAISCSVYAATYEAPFIDSGSRNKYLEVSVDGIPRLFAFDTGCSGLSINMQLLNELVHQNKVKLSDLSGEHNAELANGYTHVVRELIIDELSVGGYTFREVVADVGIHDAPDAPLLLGQSILERLRWYQIAGNTFRFEPYDERHQLALTVADYYCNDSTRQREIAELLMPYERQGELNCYYRKRLFRALHYIDAYEDAIAMAETLKTDNCRSTIDVAEYEIQLHYNQAVRLYNDQRFADALPVADKAWALVHANAGYVEYVSLLGNLYWHIYDQLGNEAKAKEFERYKE